MEMRILILSLSVISICLAAKDVAKRSNYKNKEYRGYGDYEKTPNYNYNYNVKDGYGTDFKQEESREGENTKGNYEVALPDGRIQVVSYVADENGYFADIQYKGESKSEQYIKHPSGYSHHSSDQKPSYPKQHVYQKPPSYPASSHPQQKYERPSYKEPSYKPQPKYPKPSYPGPKYERPSYPEPKYERPTYTTSRYEERRYPKPNHPEPVYPKPQYNKPSYPGYRPSSYPSPPYPPHRQPYGNYPPVFYGYRPSDVYTTASPLVTSNPELNVEELLPREDKIEAEIQIKEVEVAQTPLEPIFNEDVPELPLEPVISSSDEQQQENSDQLDLRSLIPTDNAEQDNVQISPVEEVPTIDITEQEIFADTQDQTVEVVQQQQQEIGLTNEGPVGETIFEDTASLEVDPVLSIENVEAAPSDTAEPESTLVQVFEPEFALIEPVQPEVSLLEPVEPEGALLEPVEIEDALIEPVEQEGVLLGPIESELAPVELSEIVEVSDDVQVPDEFVSDQAEELIPDQAVPFESPIEAPDSVPAEIAPEASSVELTNDNEQFSDRGISEVASLEEAVPSDETAEPQDVLAEEIENNPAVEETPFQQEEVKTQAVVPVEAVEAEEAEQAAEEAEARSALPVADVQTAEVAPIAAKNAENQPAPGESTNSEPQNSYKPYRPYRPPYPPQSYRRPYQPQYKPYPYKPRPYYPDPSYGQRSYNPVPYTSKAYPPSKYEPRPYPPAPYVSKPYSPKSYAPRPYTPAPYSHAPQHYSSYRPRF
ncbi:hypothetical protein QYM36_015332 [Artemia franciscana]|uniref:Cuticle protein n=2 Tax=Artemia franciscana TaxID=6661 RepID=A0AA88KZS8_ARTSF|nr:hypothetical protein QYM36_015332 [Artemia franciscana]